MKTEKVTPKALSDWLKTVDRKVLIQFGAIFILFLIFIVFFFMPIAAKQQKAKLGNLGLKRQIQNGNIKAAKLPKMKEDQKLYGARIEAIRTGFFSSSDEDKITEIFTTLAGKSGVRIVATRTSTEKLELPPQFSMLYRVLNYDLTVDGSYHKIGLFMNALEEYERNFAVYHLRLIKSLNTPLMLECQLVLTVFFKEEVPQIVNSVLPITKK